MYNDIINLIRKISWLTYVSNTNKEYHKRCKYNKYANLLFDGHIYNYRTRANISHYYIIFDINMNKICQISKNYTF